MGLRFWGSGPSWSMVYDLWFRERDGESFMIQGSEFRVPAMFGVQGLGLKGLGFRASEFCRVLLYGRGPR